MASRWTFEKLYNSTIRFKPWRRNYTHNPKIRITGIIPYLATKSVLFQGEAFGLTQKSIHKENLLFSGVEIIEEKPNMSDEEKPDLFDFIKIEYKNKTYYVQKINPRRHFLSVRCSCSDFFYRFAWENHRHGCLYGPAPRPYKRKTNTYPPQNPMHYSGICKHVYNLYSFLRASGYTSEQGSYR